MRTQDVIHIVVLTPEKTILDVYASKVSLPGSLGSFVVLNNHAPLISSLEKGYIIYEVAGAEHRLMITTGFVEVCNNEVIVCAEV